MTAQPESTSSAQGSAPAPAPAPPRAPARGAEKQRLRNAAAAPLVPERVPWLAVGIFVVIALGGAWAVQMPLWLSEDGIATPLFPLYASAMMFTPTIAALVVVFLVARPRSIPRLLGLGPIRPVGRTIAYSVLALVGFPILAFLAMLLGDAMGLIRLDFSFAGFGQTLAAQGLDVDRDAVVALAVVQLLVIPINALVSSVTAFGEELGWRGWLLPNLLPLGTWPALLGSGLIWGVWHAPLILLGYNYGRTDILGVLMMTGWCILLGVVIGWLRLRTASVWPAVFAHGAVNAAATTLLVMLTAAPVDMSVIYGSLLGWSGWIVLAIVIVIIVATGGMRRLAVPGLTLREAQEMQDAREAQGPQGTQGALRAQETQNGLRGTVDTQS